MKEAAKPSENLREQHRDRGAVDDQRYPQSQKPRSGGRNATRSESESENGVAAALQASRMIQRLRQAPPEKQERRSNPRHDEPADHPGEQKDDSVPRRDLTGREPVEPFDAQYQSNQQIVRRIRFTGERTGETLYVLA